MKVRHNLSPQVCPFPRPIATALYHKTGCLSKTRAGSQAPLPTGKASARSFTGILNWRPGPADSRGSHKRGNEGYFSCRRESRAGSCLVISFHIRSAPFRVMAE